MLLYTYHVWQSLIHVVFMFTMLAINKKYIMLI